MHYVRGEGSTGALGRRNGRIEMKVIYDEAVADQIAKTVFAKYGTNYALTLFFSDVAVLRASKY